MSIVIENYKNELDEAMNVFLGPIVVLVNKRLDTVYGVNAVEYADFVYKATAGNKQRILKKHNNGKIQWDIYNITTFINIKDDKTIKKDGISKTINIKRDLFYDFREDIFPNLLSLRAMRNETSHQWNTGTEESSKVNRDDLKHYLSLMDFILKYLKEHQNTYLEIEKIGNINQSADKKIQKLQGEQERVIINELEKNDPQYKNERIYVSLPLTLCNVFNEKRVNSKGKTTKCTVLKFVETNEERRMDEWCDPGQKKYNLAKALIGKKVRTTIWKPPNLDPKKWFRNIYEYKEF